jgi:CRISPR-associated protein Cas5a/b/c
LIAGFLVDIEFVWGFQARVVGLSKTSPSFSYPPPTTFLGALAEAISKNLRLGESSGRRVMAELAKNLLAIGLKPINCRPMKYADVNRIISIKVTSGQLHPTLMNLAGSFDSPARGKTILQSLDGGSPVIRWVLVFKDDRILIGDHGLDIENNSWRIHRLGSKESRVCVLDVKRLDVKTNDGQVKTTYSMPLNLVRLVDPSQMEGKWVVEQYLDPFDEKSFEKPVEDYLKETTRFMLPIREYAHSDYSYARVEPIKDAEAYFCGEEVVIGRGHKG